jgi:hypothetical protein
MKNNRILLNSARITLPADSRFYILLFASGFLLLVFASSVRADQDLSSKVVRVPLNQDQPAVIKLGLQGITTIEFPSLIEALDGYGFSSNPNPSGPDQFQISFTDQSFR